MLEDRSDILFPSSIQMPALTSSHAKLVQSSLKRALTTKDMVVLRDFFFFFFLASFFLRPPKGWLKLDLHARFFFLKATRQCREMLPLFSFSSPCLHEVRRFNYGGLSSSEFFSLFSAVALRTMMRELPDWIVFSLFPLLGRCSRQSQPAKCFWTFSPTFPGYGRAVSGEKRGGWAFETL